MNGAAQPRWKWVAGAIAIVAYAVAVDHANSHPGSRTFGAVLAVAPLVAIGADAVRRWRSPVLVCVLRCHCSGRGLCQLVFDRGAFRPPAVRAAVDHLSRTRPAVRGQPAAGPDTALHAHRRDAAGTAGRTNATVHARRDVRLGPDAARNRCDPDSAVRDRPAARVVAVLELRPAHPAAGRVRHRVGRASALACPTRRSSR